MDIDIEPDIEYVTTHDQWLDNDPGRMSVIEDGYWKFKKHLRETGYQDLCDKLELIDFMEMVFRSTTGCPTPIISS